MLLCINSCQTENSHAEYFNFKVLIKKILEMKTKSKTASNKFQVCPYEICLKYEFYSVFRKSAKPKTTSSILSL